jgi:hypothetical protein
MGHAAAGEHTKQHNKTRKKNGKFVLNQVLWHHKFTNEATKMKKFNE